MISGRNAFGIFVRPEKCDRSWNRVSLRYRRWGCPFRSRCSTEGEWVTIGIAIESDPGGKVDTHEVNEVDSQYVDYARLTVLNGRLAEGQPF